MAASTKATGSTIRPTILDDFCIKMAIFTRVNGLMIKHMALVTTSTKTVVYIVASGRTTRKMAEVLSAGPTALNSRATTAMGLSKVMASLRGPMETPTRATLRTITFRARVSDSVCNILSFLFH